MSTDTILIEADPQTSLDRAAARLNVVGASTDATRGTIGSSYYYINTATGDDTTGDGSIGNPWKTITKFESAHGGRTGIVLNGDAIVLNSGAETITGISRPLMAAVGVAPEITLSGAWAGASQTPAAAGNYDIKILHNGTTYLEVKATSNVLATSTNGTSWTGTTFGGTLVNQIDAAYGAGHFVALRATAATARSTDGATWSGVSAASGWTNASVYSICYGHLGFVCFGADIGVGAAIQFSNDGASWTYRTITNSGLPAGNIASATHKSFWSNGRYYFYCSVQGVVYCIYSDDLVNFTATATPNGSFIPSNGSGNHIAVGSGIFVEPSGRYSYDGIVWSTKESTFSGDSLDQGDSYKGVAYGAGAFLMTRTDGYYYSLNGLDWVGVSTTSFGGSAVGFGHVGFILGQSDDVSFTLGLVKGGIRLAGSVCGFEFPDDGLYIASTNAAVTVKNCTAPYGVDALKDANGHTIQNSIVRNIRANENIPAEYSENVVTENTDLFKTYASTTDINRNTFVGHYSDWDTTTTDIDQFRDNLIGRGLFTNRVLTVESGNIQGYVAPSVTLAAGTVYAVDPQFVDPAAGDYNLATQADGLAENSPLIGKSTFYNPDGTSGSGRDLGAYSFDMAQLETDWALAIPLPKPRVSQWGDRPSAAYTSARSGKRQGVNYPDAWSERIAVEWVDLSEAQFALLKQISYLDSVRVRLTWDREAVGLASVTADGGNSTGSPFIQIDAADTPAGALVRVGSTKYPILRRHPATGQATQIVLGRNLLTTVSDNDVLTVEGVAGYGEYIIEWQELEKGNLYYSLDKRTWSGVRLAFSRIRAVP